MFGRRLSAAALALLLGGTFALACGPFFPWQLLDDRVFTLKSTPSNSFAFEAAHLVALPRDRLKAVELGWTQSYQDDERMVVWHAERAGLPQPQSDQIDHMRQAASGDAAFAAGEGLPAAVRLYTAGAVDYAKSNLAHAEGRFAAVLALPDSQQRSRATWAAFSLGKTYALGGDNARAAAAFEQTRALAIHGAPDPLGLATASFGEEARLHYDAANGVLVPANIPTPARADPGSSGGVPLNPGFIGYVLHSHDVDAYRREITLAASLYSQQAARDSDSGVQSLRIVAEGVLSDPFRINAAIASPLLQRLLVAYVLARVRDNSQQDDLGHAPDAGARERGISLNPILPALVAAIERQDVVRPAGADRLAALCYRIGRYDLAERLADQSTGPLAEWVKAKIATQNGDLAAAAQHYAGASRAFPVASDALPLDPDNMNLIQGDRGVVGLARGEYVEALNALYPVARTYWGDVAYIAERVLTVDELKDFADANVHVSPQPAPSRVQSAAQNDPAVLLSNLLARRLMREGRFDEAQRYFQDMKVGQQAKAYAAALHEADSDWGRVDRAGALFRAAVIARQSGMDILGYEAAPDFEWTSGDFDFGVGQDNPKGPYITGNEHARLLASQAVPNQRYHYRYIAADEASRAADLLPPRSQAYAAVLCSATKWVVDSDSARARVFYRRYIANGAHLKWAAMFGRECPQPDFNRAIYLERVQPFRDVRRFVSVHRWWVAGIGLIAMAFPTTLVLRRKETIAGATSAPTFMLFANRVVLQLARLFRR
jgi:tetratricopeptide (TPR) repeat protein